MTLTDDIDGPVLGCEDFELLGEVDVRLRLRDEAWRTHDLVEFRGDPLDTNRTQGSDRIIVVGYDAVVPEHVEKPIEEGDVWMRATTFTDWDDIITMRVRADHEMTVRDLTRPPEL